MMNKKLFGILILEAKSMIDKGYSENQINEAFQEVTESFGSILSMAFFETIKRSIAKNVLKYFNIDPNSFMSLVFENAFANLAFKDYGKVLKDCDFTSSLLAETLIDTLLDQTRIKKGLDGDLYVGIQAALMDVTGKLKAVEMVRDKMTEFICPKLAGVREKVIKNIPLLSKVV